MNYAIATRTTKSVAGGLVWGLIGLARGVTLPGYCALACGAGLTLWLLAPLAEGLWRRAEHRAWAACAALATLCLWPLAYFLWRFTHHRPLGAVTFAVLGTGALAFLALGFGQVASRVRVSRGLGLGLGLAVVAVALLGVSDAGRVEACAGLLCLVGVCVSWPAEERLGRLAVPLGGALLLGSAGLLLAAAPIAEAQRVARLTLGLLGTL